jgi:transposase InsO family protein
MGVVIQAESHKNELAGVYEMEHDPTVLEFFDQPPPIKLSYQARNGRQIGVLHTPDYFVLRTDAVGWEEWKTEEDLERLAEQMPHRYLRHEDGRWRCPPGEHVATPLSFYYRVRSSREIHWIFQRNLRFLEDYLRSDCPAVQPQKQDAVISLVKTVPGITLEELLEHLEGCSPDEIYALIAAEALYIDVYAAPLVEPERVRLFSDEEIALAWKDIPIAPERTLLLRPRPAPLHIGMEVNWDGVPWTLANMGGTTATLLSHRGDVLELPIGHFQTLVSQEKIVGTTPTASDPLSAAAREHLAQADQAALKEANRRYRIIKPILEGQQSTDSSIPARTIRDWVAKYRRAAQTLGCGYIGLLPHYYRCGNRLPRLPEQVISAMKTFVEERYETHKQKSKTEVYGEFVRYCQAHDLMTIPSYKTFVAMINRRPRYEQTSKRAGSRMAYAHEPMYWELSHTLPRHGDRPFEVAHLDHTELDVQLIDSQTGHCFGRPWATLLTDAFSRRILAVYLTFDEPSYRSCMMTLRECVSRYRRLPQTIIVDWGPEFESMYFETLLARYECSKATRPKAKPRFGSVIERLFGTTNTQFVHNLAGNTQMMKHVRQVTQSVDPRRHATWTLGSLYSRLREWAYEVYDTREHPALGQTPQEAFQAGLARSGMRGHREIEYTDEFVLLTLPTTPKETAKVQPNRGVRIKYLYYWARGDAFRDAEVEKTQVAVRYDPYDVGHAYAFVKGVWVECISEHYASFKGRSEREILLASEELRQRHVRHTRQFSITSAKLAEFITSVEAEEALLIQRQRDAEARAVFTLMGGDRQIVEEPPISHQVPLVAGRTVTHERAAGPGKVTGDEGNDEDIYDDY